MPLSEERLQELEDLIHILQQDALGRVARAEPLRPRGQERRPRRIQDSDADHLLQHIEPPQVAAEHDVHVPGGVSAEVALPLGAVLERAFQRLQRRDRLRRAVHLLVCLTGEQHSPPCRPDLIMHVQSKKEHRLRSMTNLTKQSNGDERTLSSTYAAQKRAVARS